MTPTPLDAAISACATIDFDHHGPEMPEKSWEGLSTLRKRCPVAHTEAHGGLDHDAGDLLSPGAAVGASLP
jgi:hypothetical protein